MYKFHLWISNSVIIFERCLTMILSAAQMWSDLAKIGETIWENKRKVRRLMSANREMRYDNHGIHILYTLWENASSTSRIRHGEETGLYKCYRVCAFNCRADVYSRLSVIAFASNKGFSSDCEITLMSKIRAASSMSTRRDIRDPLIS